MVVNHTNKNFTITNQTKGKSPNLPFVNIKEKVLGKKYNLSLVFPTRSLSAKLHREWKGENGPANVLSFPLSKKEGEIFISLDKAKTECRKFGMTFNKYLIFLFIHGCLHLKGFDHGDIMEAKEKALLLFFANKN